jgi:CheY-like chemotaxis protein
MVSESRPKPDVCVILRDHIMPQLDDGWQAIIILFRPPPMVTGPQVQTPCSMASTASPDVTLQVLEKTMVNVRDNPSGNIVTQKES